MKLEEFLKKINFRYNNWNDYGYFLTADFYYDSQYISAIHINPNNQLTYRMIREGNKPSLEDEVFCLLGDETYYQFLKDILPDEQERARWFKLTNDLAYNINLFEKLVDDYDNDSFIHRSFLRGMTAGYVATDLHSLTVNHSPINNYRVVISKSDKTLFDVEVNTDSLLPTNILGIIGRNGTGKTNFLQSLSYSLLAADNNPEKELHIEYFDNAGNEVNRSEILSNVLYISYSPFDPKLVIDDTRFKPLGLHTSLDGISKEDLSNISENFSKRIYSSLQDLASPTNTNRFNYFKVIIDEYFAIEEWAVKLLNFIESNEFKNDEDDSIKNELNQFSSGQKIIVLSVINIILEISANSFVIIDEPELFLHPGLLKAYINAITAITKELKGLTFIATHNPLVLQEIVGKGVRETRYEEGFYSSKSIKIETYGESIEILNNTIFGLDMKQTGFYDYIYKLFDNNLVNYDNYNDLSDNLGSTGKIIFEYLSEKEL